MYEVERTEPQLWTVGVYREGGQFDPRSDHDSREEALAEADRLNGVVDVTVYQDRIKKLQDGQEAMLNEIADLEAQLAAAKQPITLAKLDGLLDEYEKAKLEVATRVTRVTHADNDEALIKARTLSNAYADGKITGKNAAQRDLQETLVLEADTHYIQQRQKAIEARQALTEINARADILHQRISLYKAFLYAQSGGEA